MSATTPRAVRLRSDFPATTQDALRPSDLLRDEIDQRHESGYEIDDIVRAANQADLADRELVLSLVDSMVDAPRRAGWSYEEPDDLEDIRAVVADPGVAGGVSPRGLEDRIAGAWLGRIVGVNIGKPVEIGDRWTVERIRAYLEAADAYPLRDYIPLLDPMPDGFELESSWPLTTRGNVDGSARDDDIDFTILGLHLLETYGAGGLRPERVGEEWLSLLPLRQVYTAERVAYINVVCGLTPPATARYRNPYREWIGAQIRGDIFGYVLPGKPWAAAALSYQDASLSHVGNGIYGEMWAAALVSAALAVPSVRAAVTLARGVVPPRSRLAEALRSVEHMRDSGLSWDEALSTIHSTYGHYSWVHTINNAALVAAALLWSDDDYVTAVGRVVMGGWDTDSNGGTVGSVMGALGGSQGLPGYLTEPLHDRTRSALFGFDNSRISELSARTYRLASNSSAR